MNYKEILNKLPGNWQELKLKDYIKLSPVINDSDREQDIVDEDIYTSKVVSDLDKNIQIISLLTDTNIEDIEIGLTMFELNELINKLSFLSVVPQKVKTTIKYKAFEDLSYDGFITFDKLNKDFSDEGILGNAIENLPTMLSVFALDKSHNEEYFLNQSMPEVIAGFFTVSNNINLYLQRLKRSSLKVLMRNQIQMAKNLMTQYLQKVNPFQKNSKRSGVTG